MITRSIIGFAILVYAVAHYREPQDDGYIWVSDITRTEHENHARYMRHYVGKRIPIKGEIDFISDDYFSMKAEFTLTGLSIHIDDLEFLSRLDKGDIAYATCDVVNLPLIGSTIKNCSDISAKRR